MIPEFLVDLGNKSVQKNTKLDDCGPIWIQTGGLVNTLLPQCTISRLKGFFHMHTKYSFDSILEPAEIIRYAEEHGYNIVAITDHNTIKGSVEASMCAKDGYPIVIIGAEYATDKGDIIGLFLREEIRSRNAAEVISAIKAQGGIVVLPHPYKRHRLDNELLQSVDLVEVHNPRVPPELNNKAKKLCQTHNKGAFVGCDAHFVEELDMATITFENPKNWDIQDLLLTGEKLFSIRQGNQMYEILSQTIKQVKSQRRGVH